MAKQHFDFQFPNFLIELGGHEVLISFDRTGTNQVWWAFFDCLMMDYHNLQYIDYQSFSSVFFTFQLFIRASYSVHFNQNTKNTFANFVEKLHSF